MQYAFPGFLFLGRCLLCRRSSDSVSHTAGTEYGKMSDGESGLSTSTDGCDSRCKSMLFYVNKNVFWFVFGNKTLSHLNPALGPGNFIWSYGIGLDVYVRECTNPS